MLYLHSIYSISVRWFAILNVMPTPQSKLKKISYIHPSSFARVLAAVFSILTLVWVMPTAIRLIVIAVSNGQWPIEGAYRVAMIVVVAALSYVTALLLAITYNMLAKYSGGIEIELSDV